MDDRDTLAGLAARTPNHSREAVLLHRAGERVRQPSTYDPNRPPTAVMVVGDLAGDRLTQLIALVERETAGSLESNIILVRELDDVRSGASSPTPLISQDLQQIVGISAERLTRIAADPEPPRVARSWEQLRDRAERKHRRRRRR